VVVSVLGLVLLYLSHPTLTASASTSGSCQNLTRALQQKRTRSPHDDMIPYSQRHHLGNAMKIPRRGFLHLTAGAAALWAIFGIAKAQTYPSRPIRLVVPFPPGGAFDTLARPWVEKMKPLLGTMVVENIGGGGSSLGAAAVARARPDGYTILLGGSLPTVNEALLKSRPLYDPFKDLDPIAGLGVVAFALAVHPSVPAQFISHAQMRISIRPMRLGRKPGFNGCMRLGK
jgi:hypothetical protein